MSRERIPKVLVLYQITNSKGDGNRFNAFEMPVDDGVSLSSVKKHCRALCGMNGEGPDGFHWRVRVDDKISTSSTSKAQRFSWWDIQDEKARLPVKQVSMMELSLIMNGPKISSSSSAIDESVAKGAMRSLGKAMNKVAASVEGNSTDPCTPTIMFKLVDLVQIRYAFSRKQAMIESKLHESKSALREDLSQRVNNQPVHQASPQPQPTMSSNHVSNRKTSTPASYKNVPQRQQASTGPRPIAEASLMDFGAEQSVPTQSLSSSTGKLTRAEILKREYEKKKRSEKKVWDTVDQRWVTEDTKNGSSTKSTNQSSANKPKLNGKAFSIDSSSAVGKSATVAAAVNARVNDMKASQQKALNEIREREAAKKNAESEEDTVRQSLEPKIKAWSEEHGKKKQLRALIANLHTILWPGAKWKPVNLGDILDDKKLRLAYHKAARVVHPDKIQGMNSAEQRFLAKRIFDALTQAKTEYDDSK